MKKSTGIRYSEAFKIQVVEEIACGKFTSAYKAEKAYGIRGRSTVTKWIRKYGREDLLPPLHPTLHVQQRPFEGLDQLSPASVVGRSGAHFPRRPVEMKWKIGK